MKKILIYTLCLMLLMTSFSFASFNDVDYNSKYGKAIDYLVNSGILNGYSVSEFGSKDPLTRAQFAKIVVLMSGKEDEALSKTTEVFTDVPSNHWGIGYINEAAELGLITGYPNGSFGAEENITYAQAITVIIRTLGYSEAEIGTNWPTDYINKAKELMITEGLTFNKNDVISREVAAYMLYNSLYAKGGNGGGASRTFENVVLYGDNSQNSSIGKDEVLTTEGTLKKGKNFNDEYVGMKVNIKVNADNEIVMITESDENYIKGTLLSSALDKCSTRESDSVSVDENMTVYYKGGKYTYKDVYSKLNQGSTVYFYDDCITVKENKLKGPYVIYGDYNDIYTYLGSVSGLEVTIDGEKASLSDIEKFNVVYYNDVTNRIYVYTDRVTGIYEKAIPSKDNVSEIVVSGKNYSDLSLEAVEKLNNSDSAFMLYDRVTLLLGNDGQVVDVVDINGRTLDDLGVVLKSYSVTSKDEDTLGKKEFFVDMMLGSGKAVTYKTVKEYSDSDNKTYTGNIFNIKYMENGEIALESITKNRLSGNFDRTIPAYAGHEFQQNYSILELVYSEKYDEAVVRKISLKEITARNLTESDVIHVEYANDMEDIALIYVNNLTYNGFTFGVLNEVTVDEEANYYYELITNEGVKGYRGTAGWTFNKGDAVMAMVKDGKIKEMKALYTIDATGEIGSYTETRIKIGNRIYDICDNVSVVYRKIGDNDWNITTINDMIKNIKSGKWDTNFISLCLDLKTDGKVRVIKVNLK